MNRGYISNMLRFFRVLYLTDLFHFIYEKVKFRKENRAFREQFPEVPLPSDYLLYESYQLHYGKYYTGGIESARWLTGHLSRHISLENVKILDWGCGPGRLIRHLPQYTGDGCEFYGTDYNLKSIAWCKKHLPGIHFQVNSAEATLPWPDHFFDIIYGYSVLTHLSGEKQTQWYRELLRILKPGGILFVTTQGKHYKVKLTAKEKQAFNKGRLVVRGKVKEGHRTFSAFHPPAFMHNLFRDAEILDHIEPEPEPGKAIPQDIWIIRKRK